MFEIAKFAPDGGTAAEEAAGVGVGGEEVVQTVDGFSVERDDLVFVEPAGLAVGDPEPFVVDDADLEDEAGPDFIDDSGGIFSSASRMTTTRSPGWY